MKCYTSIGRPEDGLSWIYIGDKNAAKNLQQLKSNNIRYILNATQSTALSGVINYYEKDKSFTYLKLPMNDNASENLSLHYHKAWEFINRARVREDGNILIHCHMGVSRSVAIAVSYIMRYYNKSFEDCLSLIRVDRPMAQPNASFCAQLKGLEDSLREQGYIVENTTCAHDAEATSPSVQVATDTMPHDDTTSERLGRDSIVPDPSPRPFIKPPSSSLGDILDHSSVSTQTPALRVSSTKSSKSSVSRSQTKTPRVLGPARPPHLQNVIPQDITKPIIGPSPRSADS